MRPQDFYKSRIAAKALAPVTLFSGSEEFWKELHLKRIKDWLFGNQADNLNFFKFSANEQEPSTVIGEANNLGFFSAKKLIVYTDVEEVNAEGQREIIAYLEAPNPDAYLILSCQKLDGRGSLASNETLKAETVEYEVKDEKDVSQFIEFKLRELGGGGMRLETKLQQYLLQSFPRNLRLLSNNLDKIAAHNGYLEVLQMSDAVVVNSEDPETDNFALADAVASKNIVRAIEIKNILCKQKDEIFSLLGTLRWKFQSLVYAKEMLENGEAEDRIAGKLRVPFFKKKQFFEQLGKQEAGELLRKYKMIAECDMAAKSSSIGSVHLLDMLIYNLCR